MNEPKMPELPKPAHYHAVETNDEYRLEFVNVYTADQMHAYARQYAAHLEARVAELERQCDHWKNCYRVSRGTRP